MITREQVLAVIDTIPEPCSIAMSSPRSIGSMGLVDDVAISADSVTITLVLTDASCVHFGSMSRYIEDALQQAHGSLDIDVRMTTSKLWTPDRMTDRELAPTTDQ